MEFFALLIAVFVGWYLLSSVLPKIIADVRGIETRQHCMTCGSEGDPVAKTKGSLLIEIVLWLCLIVPGLIYSVWRLTSRHSACSVCGATNLVPCDTPAAKAHREQLNKPTA